jgi:hypothetical protein
MNKLTELKEQISEVLNSQDFYEVMQSYRNSPIAEQHNVVKAFNDVKQLILDNFHDNTTVILR